MKIVIVGDVCYSWVVCFNVEVLMKFGVIIYFVSLEEWKDEDNIFGIYKLLDEFVLEVDVMMLFCV